MTFLALVQVARSDVFELLSFPEIKYIRLIVTIFLVSVGFFSFLGIN